MSQDDSTDLATLALRHELRELRSDGRLIRATIGSEEEPERALRIVVDSVHAGYEEQLTYYQNRLTALGISSTIRKSASLGGILVLQLDAEALGKLEAIEPNLNYDVLPKTLEKRTALQDMVAVAENEVDSKIYAACVQQIGRLIDAVGVCHGVGIANRVRTEIPPTGETARFLLSGLNRSGKINCVELLGRQVDAALEYPTSGQLKMLTESNAKIALRNMLSLGSQDFHERVVSWMDGNPLTRESERAAAYWAVPGQERKYTVAISTDEIFAGRSIAT